jgi:DNA modification methylase
MTMLAEGQRWMVIHGDCLDVLPTIERVDHVITDPPYAISNEGMWHIGRPGKGKRRFDFFDGDSDWDGMVDTVLAAARLCMDRIAYPAGSFYAYVGHREFGPLVSLFEWNGWKTRFLVWAKASPSPPPPGSGWPSGAELCFYAFRPGRTWNYDGGHPPPNSVFTCDSFRHGQPGKVDHPTQKPLAVIEPLLLASTRPNDIVTDPFCGSGTTGVACLRLGRRFIGIEKDERYAALARERLAAESQGSTLQAARAGQVSLFGGQPK